MPPGRGRYEVDQELELEVNSLHQHQLEVNLGLILGSDPCLVSAAASVTSPVSAPCQILPPQVHLSKYLSGFVPNILLVLSFVTVHV